jgi:ferritin-like metal-binding protein YciE
MPPSNLDEQLTKYLTDAHSIEQQALAQMRSAPDIAGDPQIADAFQRHLHETEQQEQLVRHRLEARDAKPSTLKDIAGAVTGKAFVLFAKSQPDTPGKLVVHGYSYEHLEIAAYDLLTRVAEQAGDAETAQMARLIGGEEQQMAQRLENLFDRAVDASLREVQPERLNEQIDKYLADAHALEMQSIQLLEKGPDLAGSGELAAVYEEHLAETREHARLLEERLSAHGAGPSAIKDAALRLGALNWGMFFGSQPDTPAKLAGFAYAVEHLEAGAYELLLRVADRAGDGSTAELARRILGEERAAGQKIRAQFANALEAALQEQGVGAR